MELGATPQTSIQMYARAGNIENPQRAWGEWKQLTPNTGAMGIDASRFMQWKLVEHPGSVVGAVAINYLPVNLPPVMDEIMVAPGARANSIQQQPGQPQQITHQFSFLAESRNQLRPGARARAAVGHPGSHRCHGALGRA